MFRLGSLVDGTRINLDGRNGEVLGSDACAVKVRLNGREIQYWSLGTMVGLGWVSSEAEQAAEAYRYAAAGTADPLKEPAKTHTKREGTSETAKTSSESNGRARMELFGHPVSAVIRYLGKHGWTFGQARRALDKLGVACKDGTVRTYLLAGKGGYRGDPAPLTQAEVKQLRAAK